MSDLKIYVDTKVTEKQLEELRSRMDGQVGMAKYGRYQAWLHFANLNSWQNQKWHWAYVNFESVSWHCTCGLVVPMDAEAEIDGLDGLELDPAHRARGHRQLPNFDTPVVAFIYNYKWLGLPGVYYFDAFCQICGDHVDERPGVETDAFANAHNKSCGSLLVD
jgi:hypothetical protein